MKRKIIKQGHSTLTITLPIAWVKRFNLKSGGEVDISERDNGLFISSEGKSEYKKAEFDVSFMDVPTIWKYFMAVYREGYNEVLVKFQPGTSLESPYKYFTQHQLDIKYNQKAEEKSVVETLQGFVNRFIGFEIVEHGKDHIIVKEMGEINGKEFDNSLRRVFLLLQQMTEELTEAIKTNNAGILRHAHDIDINIDKFHDYCIRILNNTKNKDPKKSELLFATLYLLEMLGDELKNVAFHLYYDMKKEKFDNIKELGQLTFELFNKFYDLFYKFDEKKVVEMSKIDGEIYLYLPKVYKKKGNNSVLKNNELEILNHYRRISRYINALVELRIEMEY